MSNKHIQKAMAYFKKHPAYTATVHLLGGIAVGILITHPLIGPHPIRWALVFAAIAIAGHAYAFLAK
jgi:hypothetical protein